MTRTRASTFSDHLRWPGLALALCLSGCTADSAAWQPTSEQHEAVTISFHLAYDQPADGRRAMTDDAGEEVYLAPQPELTRADVAEARALHSAENSMLQIMLTRLGAARLYTLTRDHPGDRVAVIINDKLACAPRIYEPVASGEVRIVDVFARRRTDELARALSPPGSQ